MRGRSSLIRTPAVDTVCFPGSTAVGRGIGAICGERLASATLELGGKSAAIVLDDSDPDEIATTLGPTTMLHNGQLCNSPTRVLVPRHRHGEFVDALADAVTVSLLVIPSILRPPLGRSSAPASAPESRDTSAGL